ncbi:MAG: GNAT family N-acetyltransferase [Chloracidobacterium sp.]|uniref:GNAT family N-acetyltransferase n=1 Tax=Chloracidobacterium validum TaxID=2821543 RepID=A0ABX8BDX4_9BACT|nr:GNAT family N-acetyltransferase [Chloracidobacterium validum]QUW03270.1 GNAT family N-acetyltransferase [Chloracidobacterium validum]
MSHGQYFEASYVPAAQLDVLWAHGWRHFGTYFYRYWVNLTNDGVRHVLPLRIELANFTLSESQRRVRRRNRNLRVIIQPTVIDATTELLFERHKQRFTENIPTSIYSFLSSEPASVPCRNQEIAVYDGERLVAKSFLDLGKQASSSVYGIFDPDYAKHSLGIFTMLLEIEYSQARGDKFYYPGYAYHEPSHYDYKKRFSALEWFDWNGHWRSLPNGHCG